MENLILSVLFLAPLAGFLFNGLRFRSENCILSGTVGTIACVSSFVSVLCLFYFYIQGGKASLEIHFFNWLHVGSFKANAAFLIDSISLTMAAVITGVGALIHLFSIGYMNHDKRPSKYFAYLNFFIFNMLILILADNLPLMFIGWEGVGLCSYLLIGFWFQHEEKAKAGMKAFIVNRVGDLGFLFGIFTLFYLFGTVQFKELEGVLPTVPVTWGLLPLACLSLFVGAMGKSAQIPLYVWLPDAMAGPTPVSALIHAATMVTAGVYMIIRLHDLFILAPSVMLMIAITGACTALMAALIATSQWDIKKILAYSTVSQLGYMFLAVGVGAFTAGLFHLVTHAFFKALMFLGAGSVIHSLSGEQDIRKMGSLKKQMPITYVTFFWGWLAIIGIPPFAGFFSKDEILWFSWSSTYGHPILWCIGFLTAVLTAFYMTRLMGYVFWQKKSSNRNVKESPYVMTFPLCVLGILSCVGGMIGIPHIISAVLPGHLPHILDKWVSLDVQNVRIPHASVTSEWILMGLSVIAAIGSAFFAYALFVRRTNRFEKLVKKLVPAQHVFENKFFIDEIYQATIVLPLNSLSRSLWNQIDAQFIDKIGAICVFFVRKCGLFFKEFQRGNLQVYAIHIFFGLVMIVTIVFLTISKEAIF